jgi:streptogramin lyase
MRLRAVLLAAVLALTIAPAAEATSIFALSDPAGKLDSPASIAAGHDGTMWVANAGPLRQRGPERYAIGQVSLAGRYRLFRTKGETYGIAVLPDGTVFATEPYTSRIARITPDGVVTEFPTPTFKATPGAIAPGPDGNAWFAESGLGDVAKIARITPVGVITEYSVPPLPYLGTTIPADVGTIVPGSDDRLWFTTGLGIGSISTSGAVTTVSLPDPTSPQGLALATDGALWVTNANLSRVDRLTPDGQLGSLDLPESSDGVSIAPAGDGTVYFTQAVGHTLWHAGAGLEPINLQVVDRVRRVAKPKLLSIAENGGSPGVAMGPAGTLWIAASISRKGGVKGGVAVVNLGGGCIVPDLSGDTLGLARLDVANHACTLATLHTAPKAKVACQDPPAGTVLDHGALVTATFGKCR